MHVHAAAACPGGATWCDGFEDGAARWTTVAGTADSSGNQLLRLGAGATLASRDAVAPASGAWFVEARMRAVANTGPGQSYLLARFADERNWLGAGVETPPRSPKVNVVIVKMEDGKLTKLKQWGKESLPDGAFYTVRLALAGDELTLYLNGERLTNASEPAAPGRRIGLRIGLNTQGTSFEIDDVRIGAAAVPPGRIGLARVNNRIAVQAGDAPRRYLVSTQGARPALAAISSDPSVARAVIDKGVLVVTPLRPGRATVGVQDGADANVAAWLGVDVGTKFASPQRAYPAQGRFTPGAGEVQVDAVLRIRFDRPPTLGTSGSVRIFRAADNALVDTINVGDELDTMGTRRQAFKRVVRRKLVNVDGDSAIIRPHSASLAYGTDYYVQVDPGVFANATLGGVPFAGLGGQRGWTFRTRATPPSNGMLTVDDDGPADFRTVQGALNHAMGSPRATPVTIRVANGRYDELLYLNGKDNITLRGESRDGVVIGSINDDGTNPGSGSGQGPLAPGATGGRAVFLVEDADLLTLDTLTLVNTAQRVRSLGAQAEALNFNSDRGRLVATNASFFSEQDTIQVKGYSWFNRSLIAGNVDFIWGGNRAALFEESEIRSVGDSANPRSGGYVVQARTLGADDPGFVFLNSRLTHGPGPAGNDVPLGTTYLARPGTPQSFDKVSYINCRIDAHVAPVGWSLPQGGRNAAHTGAGAGWTEYGSMDMNGAPLDLARRAGGRTLDAAQAAALSDRAQVFRDFDGGKGWNPATTNTQ